MALVFLAETGDGNEREVHGRKTCIGQGARSHDCVCGVATGNVQGN